MSKLSGVQRVHLVGIRGVAMTGMAVMLDELGKKVTGSDTNEVFQTEQLLVERNIVPTPLSEELPAETEAVIFTSAHGGSNNPQVQQAMDLKLPTWNHAAALGELFSEKKQVAVCGVGGKSTTTALLAWIGEQKKAHELERPSYSVGVAGITGLASPSHFQRESAWAMVEADEYVADPAVSKQPRFSYLNTQIIICTNLRHDHPDVYTNFDDTKRTFASFFHKLPPEGVLIANGDDSQLRQLVSALNLSCQVRWVGWKEGNEMQLSEYQASEGIGSANLAIDGKNFQLQTTMPGEFSLHNVAMAVAAAAAMGIDTSQAVTAAAAFRSTARRFEYKGTKQGVRYYDDYAHHPHEVAATIKAARSWFPSKRLIIAFQPHTFSRTQALFDEFVSALSLAPELVLLDIFGSARESSSDTTPHQLIAALQSKINHFLHLSTAAELANYCQTVPADSVVLTMGAGDIYKLHEILHEN